MTSFVHGCTCVYTCCKLALCPAREVVRESREAIEIDGPPVEKQEQQEERTNTKRVCLYMPAYCLTCPCVLCCSFASSHL